MDRKRESNRQRTRVDADAGVQDCIEIMTAGEWVAGRSHKIVADKHGVSPATVKDWATSASRVIRALATVDQGEIRTRILTGLERATELAFKQIGVTVTGEEYSKPDIKGAVSALVAQAQILGLITNKHEVTSKPPATMSREEHRAALKKLQEEIAAEEARLQAEEPTIQ